MPVIACISAAKNGKLFNVNADTLAGSLAARLQAKRLVIAGATPGVLDKKNRTIEKLDKERIEKLVKSGTANAGMVAKLAACQAALKGGAKNVVIVDTRNPDEFEAGHIAGALFLPLEGRLTWPEEYEPLVKQLIASKKPVVAYCA